jgi:integrase
MLRDKQLRTGLRKHCPRGILAGGRRGLGTNLYRLGVPEKTIQAILRHPNVSTTATHYIKTAAADAQAAMAKLETELIGQQMGNGREITSERRNPEGSRN